MPIRLGINGFGRIGRTIFRLIQNDPEIEVVKINDVSPTDSLAYLLKYDSVHGNFSGEVEALEGAIRVNNRKILVSKTAEIQKIDWRDTPIDIVLECTGRLDGR